MALIGTEPPIQGACILNRFPRAEQSEVLSLVSHHKHQQQQQQQQQQQ